MPRRAWLAAIQISLDISLRKSHSWWATIDHRANCRTMRFTKGGDREQKA
jgi:hypothetical protein